jgi:structural maintenance of chromosome 2
MKDFDTNKDGKLVELQSSLDSLRKALTKNSASVKVLQKELQGARLDSEQVGADLGAAQEQLQEVEQTLKAQAEEIATLLSEQAQLKVCNLFRIFVQEADYVRTLSRLLKPILTMNEQN